MPNGFKATQDKSKDKNKIKKEVVEYKIQEAKKKSKISNEDLFELNLAIYEDLQLIKMALKIV